MNAIIDINISKKKMIDSDKTIAVASYWLYSDGNLKPDTWYFTRSITWICGIVDSSPDHLLENFVHPSLRILFSYLVSFSTYLC